MLADVAAFAELTLPTVSKAATKIRTTKMDFVMDVITVISFRFNANYIHLAGNTKKFFAVCRRFI